MKEREVFYSIELINHQFNHFIEQQLEQLGLNGLTSSHCFVMETLFHAEGRMSMSEISASINRTKSTCTELVNKLQNFQLVTREKCTFDKRIAYVALTADAKALYQSFADIKMTISQMVTKALSGNEQDAFISMMDKIQFQLNQKTVKEAR